jgi:hypothetical protein
MKFLAVILFALVPSACGASLVDQPNQPGSCANHMMCPHGCCTAANLDGAGWMCSSNPDKVCEYTGEGVVGPGDAFGAKRKSVDAGAGAR